MPIVRVPPDPGKPAAARSAFRRAGAGLGLPGQHPAGLSRRRPHRLHAQGCDHGRRVHDPSGLSRLALRQRLQPVRPHLAGDRAGHGQVPRPERRHQPAASAQQSGNDGAPGRGGIGARDQRAAGADPLQHVCGGVDQRQRGARGQLGKRHSRDGAAFQSRASPVDELRMDRDGLPRAPGRQHGDHRFRFLDRDGLPGAGRPVRELGHAAGGHPVGPALHAQCPPGRDQCQAAGRQQYQPGYQHLHPDRPGGAGGSGQQELDPDRPVRQADPPPGQADPRGHARSLPAAAAADHHDVDGVHPGRGAPALRPRRRGRDAPVAGNRGFQRHDRRDVLRRDADAGLLLRDRFGRRIARFPKPDGAPRRQDSAADPAASRPFPQLFRLASRRSPMAERQFHANKTEEPELIEHK